MKLSVIIVNYNVKYYLAQCLHSLEKALYGIEAEIIVVDNHSHDNSVEYLRNIYPNIRYIENNHNDGFARANNKAIRQAKGEYVLLLNPDTIVGEQTLARAVNFLDMHPGSGTLGVKMLNTDGTYAMESRRGVPTPMTAFYKFTGLWKRYPDSRKFARYYMSYLSWDEPHKIDIVSGAFCMVKREVIEKVGLLDEDYFMYGEDIDFSYRIQKAGYTNWYLPVEILHYKGESTQKTSFKYVHVFYGAMYIFYRKHFASASRWLNIPVHLAIFTKASLALINNVYNSIIKSLGFFRRCKNEEPQYIIFCSKDNLERCQELVYRNGISAEIIQASEETMPQGHATRDISKKASSVCVVYDTSVFAYRHVFAFMQMHSQPHVKIGMYHPERNIIITPNEVLR